MFIRTFCKRIFLQVQQQATTAPKEETSNAAAELAAGWKLECTYSLLPPEFYVFQRPDPVPSPRLLALNLPLCVELGLDPSLLQSHGGAEVFSGNRLPVGSKPLAMAYAGHQYAHFTLLGDGRALLLGEQISPDGTRRDLHFKGSGPTPFARRGDGKAAIGPMLREFLVGEFLHAVGTPTSRALAVVATGETIYRDRPLPGAVLTRVASSHIRVGTFQYAALQKNPESLRALTSYTLWRHYPHLVAQKNPALSLLQEAIHRQARLIAQWMNIGFVHGVMNTDNMAISGETIDLGPCAFLDTYHPDAVFSSIDHYGRYAYSRQPAIAQWNLARFAEAILPLINSDKRTAIQLAQEALETFPEVFHQAWLDGIRNKLGLQTPQNGDLELIQDFFTALQETKADFTLAFRALAEGSEPQATSTDAQPMLTRWYQRWRKRLELEPSPYEQILASLRSVNPAIIPRNHKINSVLDAAENGNLSPFLQMLEALRDPFEKRANYPEFREPPPPGSPPCVTFCGT
ncbi:MAG: YdiU family protein [Chthoniobacterales bacterium]|nr:YdiU family protein [Chthoniobacterales bacterium]